MSGNLDQSLDEIIGKRPQRPQHRRNAAGPKRTGKQVNVHRARPQNGRRPIQRNVRVPVNAVSRVSRLLNTSGHVKVNVEGLPRDIKQDAVRVCY